MKNERTKIAEDTLPRFFEEQVELIQLSWGTVSRVKPKVGIISLQKLFYRSPRIRNMFPSDITKAAKKLMVTLEAVVHNLNEIDSVEHIIQSLAEEYYNYGLKPKDFKRWKNSVLWGIHRAMGDQWSDILQQSWEEVLRHIDKKMMTHIRYYKKFQ